MASKEEIPAICRDKQNFCAPNDFEPVDMGCAWVEGKWPIRPLRL